MYSWYDDESSDSTASSKSSIEKKPDLEKIEPGIEDTKVEIEATVIQNLIDKIRSIACVSKDLKNGLDDNNRIKNFLLDSDAKCLFVSFAKNATDESSVVPQNISFTYFIKSNQLSEIDEINFLQHVSFGSVNVNFESTWLLTLKYVFTFIVYCSKEMPYQIRIQTAEKLEKFSAYVTDTFYKRFGLCGIYLPALALISEKERSNSFARVDDMLDLYEDFIVHWIKQINNAIFDDEMDYHYLREFNPLILHEFWIYKWFNLKQIQYFVEDQNAVKIYDFLDYHNSAHTRSIFEIIEKLQDKEKSVKLNVSFLQVLKRISTEIENSPIKSVPSLFPDLFLYANIIVEELNYFSVSENRILLIICLCQQIINICKRRIDGESIFSGETEESMNSLVESVQTCCLFKEVLRQDSAFASIAVNQSKQILNIIDMFNHRCIDLLNICSLVNVFFNLANERKDQSLKMECFLKMKQHMKKISEMFDADLGQFKIIQKNIFEFQNDDWFDRNCEFLNKMVVINNEITRHVEEAFQYVSTSEDAIDILRITYQFSKLHDLHYFFAEKHDQPACIMMSEIETTRKNILLLKINSSNSSESCQDRCVAFCFRRKRRIQYLTKLLKKCHWLMQRDSITHCLKQYEETINDIDEFIINEYQKWLSKYQTSVLNRLKRSLIKYCFYQDGLLEVNIDRKLLKIIDEANNWIQIGFLPTTSIEKLLNLAPQILTLFQNVENLVFTHNRIFAILIPDEQMLRSQIMKQCSSIMRPTLSTVFWDSDNSSKIVADCLKQVQHIENIICEYKYQSNRIIDLNKSICILKLSKISETTLIGINGEMELANKNFFKKLVVYFEEISARLHAVFGILEANIGKTKPIWKSYVDRADSMLECALRCCVKNNLRAFIDDIVPDEESGHVTARIQLRIEIIDKEMVYSPGIPEIKKFFDNFCLGLLNIISLIPRLINKFKSTGKSKRRSYSKQLSQSGDIIEAQKRINDAIKENLRNVEERVQSWDQFKSLWEADSRNSIEIDCKNSLDVDEYREHFSSYICIVEQMRHQKNVEIVLLFELDMTKLRAEVIRQCENRIQCLSEVVKMKLLEVTRHIDQQIDVNVNEFSTFDFNSADYLSFMTNMFAQKAEIKKEIQRIRDFISLLHEFDVLVEQEIIEKQDLNESKWHKYENLIKRCCLKVKAMHNVTFDAS